MAHARLLSYAVAVVSVGFALPLTLRLAPLGQGATPLFLAAVMVSAWYGGLGPGLVATALSAFALTFFLPPSYSLGTGLADGLRLGVFVLVAVLISSLNAARRRLEEALRQQDRRKDEFLAMLAHELRSPLSAIVNAVEVLRRGGTTQVTVDQPCDIVGRQAQYMGRLINDLLDVSRIRLGKIQLHEELVDVARVVDHALEAMQGSMKAGHHRLEVSLPTGPVRVRADPTRLEQILVNLLTNAAKYTDPGGHIHLTVEQVEGEVLWRVRDTGIGLTPEVLPHVFDLHTQAENGSKGGLGIGLSLVRSLVQLHGGRVTAFSDGPGRGSEFVVHLPAPAESPLAREGAASRVA